MKKETKGQQQPALQQSSDKPKQAPRIHLRVITEEERELYRVPVYDYLLP
ncbi:MAG: hypothetical protein NC102_08330 [Clostridium sp.]|nr:hypothetical protein [Clostridium sp.]